MANTVFWVHVVDSSKYCAMVAWEGIGVWTIQEPVAVLVQQGLSPSLSFMLLKLFKRSLKTLSSKVKHNSPNNSTTSVQS